MKQPVITKKKNVSSVYNPRHITSLFSINEEFTKKMIDCIPGLVAVYNINTGKYLYVNDSVTKILGYPRKLWLTEGLAFVSSLVHPDDLALITKQNLKALKNANSKTYRNEGNNPIVQFEYRVKHKNGSWRWLKTDGVVFSRDQKGKVECVMNISVDITERKQLEEKAQETRIQAEEALRKNEEQFRAIWESAADAMVLSDKNGTVLSANKAYYTLYGFTPAEVIGKSFFIIFPENSRKDALKSYKSVYVGTAPLSIFESTITRKNGEERIVSSRYSFVKFENERVMLSIIRDITEQRKAQAELRENEERLRLALEAGKIGVWEWDIPSNTITWSDQVYAFYGASPKTFQVTYENFSKHLHPDDAKVAEEAIQNAVRGIKDYDITYRIITLKGETRWITSRAIVTRDSKGKPLRMLGATSDTTEEKRLDEDKNNFISIATHELKTPVTSIKAYAEVLERKFRRAQETLAADQLSKMNAQLDKLTSLISDLLDATKIESGQLQMHKERFNFDELVAEIVEELQLTTDKHMLILSKGTKKNVHADRERIGQVLTNLISNAIKYSPHTKKILINTKATKQQVQVCVKDFGVGVPKAKQAKLFERFYRVSGPQGNTFPGLGLGLYISSEIIKRQGGRIWVESTLGKGSNFCFSLPINAKVEKSAHSRAETLVRHS